LSEAGDLRQVYQLEERLFSIRIAADSPLDGQTFAETRLGNTLGVKVLAILRDKNRHMAPDGDAILRGGDVLFVQGEVDDLQQLLELQRLEVEATAIDEVPTPLNGVSGVRLRLSSGSSFEGQTLRDAGFRQQHGVVVIGVKQGESLYRTHLADRVLEWGDELLALGRHDDIDRLREHTGLEVTEVGFSAIQELEDQVFAIGVPRGSSLAGQTIASTGLSELAGLTVAGVVRDGETRLAISPDEVLQVGDQLLVAAEPDVITDLVGLGDVELRLEANEADLISEDVGMVEASVAPRSRVVGKTLGELDFRGHYGLLALALWRDGRPRHTDLTDEPLRYGDALLLHGSRDRIRRLATDTDFIVLSAADQAPRRTKKAKYAVACLIGMVALVAGGLQPIHVAAFTAASLVVLSGALTMEEAYRAIEWKAIFLVAAVLPVGLAMERTGAAQLLADSVTTLAGPLGNYATLAAIVTLASLLSQGLDGAPAVVLMAPVVIQAAQGLGISPYPLMMGVSLAASAAFMTPFSHKANLLVMGAGGYRSMDYLRVGTPLTIVLIVLMVFMIPIFFPF
jgi:di/tricarboxylate transporter